MLRGSAYAALWIYHWRTFVIMQEEARVPAGLSARSVQSQPVGVSYRGEIKAIRTRAAVLGCPRVLARPCGGEPTRVLASERAES